MDNSLYELFNFIAKLDGKTDKITLQIQVQKKFSLIKDRSVFYTHTFAIRFSTSKSTNFSNTIISLSNLQKYDDLPFIVCLNTPHKNYLFLANTTFLSKVSHSSQELRIDNIKGSINGSDIIKTFNHLDNKPENFAELFAIHSEIGFNGNLPRLVESTNHIAPHHNKYLIHNTAKPIILNAPQRAKNFITSTAYYDLKSELDQITLQYQNEILLASLIDNVNLRGRIIEYLIAGKDDDLRHEIITILQQGTKRLPSFRTPNTLGDFIKIFNTYHTATDIKTKIMTLNSAPKAYNLDKLLEFLAQEHSVFMFYFIGIMPEKIIGQSLISMFQKDLLHTTHILKHWAGRNSRGVAQFNGQTINTLIKNPNNNIDITSSQNFLQSIINL